MTGDMQHDEQLPVGERAAIEALRADHDQLCRDLPIPSAGLVWWRASIRARAEAARRVDQPLTLAHGLAVAGIVGVACALAGLVWRMLPDGFTPVAPALSSTVALAALVLGTVLVLAPLALVVAFLRE